MKKKIFLILYFTLFILYCTAQTNVSGFINANTTWDLAGSPYIVVGNTLLSPGYTLTIEPGVIVKFDSAKVLQIDGELHAVGTSLHRITFTSNQPIPAAGDWGKIQFSDASVDAVYNANANYLSGSIMKFCDVLYGGGIGFGTIHIKLSSPYISNCSIVNSDLDGIYCDGATIRIDSSLVNNCLGFGLSFQGASNAFCNMSLKYDTISNNSAGGIYFNQSNTSCNSIPMILIGNIFMNNSNEGAVAIVNSNQNIIISDNYFESNTAQWYHHGGAIGIVWIENYQIKCNRFISNHSIDLGSHNGGAVYLGTFGNINSFLQNNIFENNSSTFGAASLYIDIANDNTHEITNNIFRGNSSPAGPCIKLIGSPSVTVPFNIISNEFSNNLSDTIIYIETLGTPDVNKSLLHISQNNFLNPNCQYELFNRSPYGGHNLNADSNYWGTTSITHIDSVIYDFFDDANQSVIFYSPILTSTYVIDTVCPVIATAIYSVGEESFFNYNIFPNPFTTTTTLAFGKEVHNAILSFYNLLGEKVLTFLGINGKRISINRENLGRGIYIFEVTEGEKRILIGKAIVY